MEFGKNWGTDGRELKLTIVDQLLTHDTTPEFNMSKTEKSFNKQELNIIFTH